MTRPPIEEAKAELDCIFDKDEASKEAKNAVKEVADDEGEEPFVFPDERKPANAEETRIVVWKP